jgi:hypothetical protein
MKDIMEGISPLPFVVDSNGETIKIRLYRGAAICDMKFVTSIPVITKLPAAQNAAYIVHACNLYPKLVGAVRGLMKYGHPDWPECQYAMSVLAKCKAQEQCDE